MSDRLQKLMEALSLLAKKSNEPDALMILELRIHEYFAGVADRQRLLQVFARRRLPKPRPSRTITSSGKPWKGTPIK
jgi:hypothetical protein